MQNLTDLVPTTGVMNWYVEDCPIDTGVASYTAAIVMMTPYKLGKSKRRFVKPFDAYGIIDGSFYGTIGLYAHISSDRPYVLACGLRQKGLADGCGIVAVESGQNFTLTFLVGSLFGNK